MEQPSEKQEHYSVECSWCGAKIREHKNDDTDAVCLRCFYQMLTNHLQAQTRSAGGDFVSER